MFNSKKYERFNCKKNKHDFHMLPECKATMRNIIASLGGAANALIQRRFPDNHLLGICVCVRCGNVLDEREEFKKEVQSFIEENDLLSKCDDLRLAAAREFFNKYSLNHIVKNY